MSIRIIGIIVNFFKTLASAVYSPELYKDVVKKPLGNAMKFFFKLALLLTAIFVVGSFTLLRQGIEFSQNLGPKLDEVSKNFPSDLEVTFKDGKTITNVAQPYFVKIEGEESEEIKNYVVIDTTTPFSTEKYREYKAFFWVTSDTIFYLNDGKVEGLPVSNLPQTTINRQVVSDFLHKNEPVIKGVLIAAIPAALAAIYIGMLFKLVYLLILALLVMWLAKLMSVALDYKKSYSVAIYAAAPLFILDTILFMLQIVRPPLSLTVLALIIVGVNLSRQKTAKA